jgi:fructose-1,6-bisphosphatase/inositol monophosphatase family enzyme
MYRHTKAIMKACEKASVNIARDLIEINHLHTSKNLGRFLSSAQLRFERNIARELSSETHDMVVYLSDGSEKNIQDHSLTRDSNCQAVIIGIDNMVNFGHGIENIAFGISLEFESRDRAIAICIPATNMTIFSENNEEFFSLWPDGLTRKIKINQSININFPSVICGSDHHNHKVNNYLLKRDIYFVSSGSILCDLVRVLENKLDIAFFNRPSEVLLNFISYIVNGAGGADGFIGDSYVFGKKSLVKSAIQRAAEESAK